MEQREYDKIVEDLVKRYPEDLNETYNCYIWYTTGKYELDDKVLFKPTYYLILKDKFINESVLRYHSEDPNKLINVLTAFLDE